MQEFIELYTDFEELLTELRIEALVGQLLEYTAMEPDWDSETVAMAKNRNSELLFSSVNQLVAWNSRMQTFLSENRTQFANQ